MRVTPPAGRLGSAALVLVLGVGLGACSGEEAGDSSAATSQSTDESTDADPAEDPAEETAEETAEADPAQTSLRAFSAAEFYPAVMAALREAESFTFSTTSDALGQATSMSGQARFVDDGIEMAASSTGTQTLEIILIDQVMYLKAPDMGTGEKFLEIDLSDPDSLFGMLGKATDPEAMFQALETPEKLELVGEEEVDGVATNRYRITVDPAAYVEAMDFPAAMKGFLPEEMVTEMWVDADNLPRRFTQTFQTPSPAGGEPVASTTEGTYSDFGADVDIAAPPADQISTEGLPGAA